MSATTSTVPRRHHTDLQPVATGSDSSNGHDGRLSSHIGLSVTDTNATLASPSLVAARAYFLQHTLPIGQSSNVDQRRKSLIEVQQSPRRHSMLAAPGGSAPKISSVNDLHEDQNLQLVSKTSNSKPSIMLEQTKSVAVSDLGQNNLDEVTATATRRPSDSSASPVADILRQVPFQYTHDRLRDWGHAYLGNTATADVFINAINLRRPSLPSVKDEDVSNVLESTMVTIRARVVPKAKERKPFLIQRQFDIQKLQASIPAIQRPKDKLCIQHRRSSRARRSSLQQIPSNRPQRTTTEGPGEMSSPLGKGAVPIHVEFALHYLPVLAALMLSGHVRKGDTIDLPVPHPEEWRSVVYYIYTGKGETTVGMKENVLFLAGNIS